MVQNLFNPLQWFVPRMTFIEFGGFKWPKTANFLSMYCAMKRIFIHIRLKKIGKNKKFSPQRPTLGSETISDNLKPCKNYDMLFISC